MSITLKLAEGRTAFAPGEVIRGELEWMTLLDAAVGAAEDQGTLCLDLVFQCKGKGTAQREIFSSKDWPFCPSSGKQSFEMETPEWPWSFSGKLMTLTWTLDATYESKSHDLESSEPVIISPSGKEIDLHHYEVEVLNEKWEKWRKKWLVRFERRADARVS